MISIVYFPALNPNDDRGTIIRWIKSHGASVRKGEQICEIETSKAAVEIVAEADGFLQHLAAAGDAVPVGSPVGAITSAENEKLPASLLPSTATDITTETPIVPLARAWTKKAFLVAKRLGIDIEALAAANSGMTLTEQDVLRAQSQQSSTVMDLTEREFDNVRTERVLLIGGAGGAGAIAIDAIRRGYGKQIPVAILDNNPKTTGMTSMGVPILGTIEIIDQLWADRTFDAAVILFTDDVNERQDCYERLIGSGIPLTNVIDPTVDIRSYVRIGTGNVIMGRCFFGLGVNVGNNNFFASHAVIEHHSSIGSHCAFGPRCTTSGRVKIGDRVRFGMNISIEPYLRIGSDSVVASGIALTSHVLEKTVVKTQIQYTSRPLAS